MRILIILAFLLFSCNESSTGTKCKITEHWSGDFTVMKCDDGTIRSTTANITAKIGDEIDVAVWNE
jgi:hypothetical protein